MKEQFDARDPRQFDARLDEWFSAYRDACPQPEPSADFMPRLWARIESRQQLQTAVAWRRWAEAFLSLAAAASLLIVLLQGAPQSTPVYYHSTYLDQLSEDAGPERMLLQEVALADTQAPMPRVPAPGVNPR
ncbi:MAG: hypothetical protein ACLQBJ_07120 [Bryobacteraceae bacterium]